MNDAIRYPITTFSSVYHEATCKANWKLKNIFRKKTWQSIGQIIMGDISDNRKILVEYDVAGYSHAEKLTHPDNLHPDDCNTTKRLKHYEYTAIEQTGSLDSVLSKFLANEPLFIEKKYSENRLGIYTTCIITTAEKEVLFVQKDTTYLSDLGAVAMDQLIPL